MSDDRSAPRRAFRWQALLQRAAGAVFVLDRRRRLLFVNPAFEHLAGLGLDRARGLHCRHVRPIGPDATLEERVAHALTPPPEAFHGQFSRARRLFSPRASAAATTAARWWDVEFVPVRAGGPGTAADASRPYGHLVLGRVLPVDPEPSHAPALLPERLAALRQRRAERYSLDLLACSAMPMQRVARQARLAADLAVPVLIMGEAGVGKQTVARVLHHLSPARERPFVALDCARLTASSLADLLRGEAPRGYGTLYLREPASLPRDLQQLVSEWLALEATGPTALPRVVAGCSRPPLEDVRSGRLLEPLYWGLATFQIDVPPLRERRDDLLDIARRMLAALTDDSDRPIKGLSAEAADTLRGHDWPGNLTELRRALRDAREHARGEVIEAGDLPLAVRVVGRMRLEGGPRAPRPIRLEEVLHQVERRLIEVALGRAQGNRRAAAELLSMPRSRLLRRISALGLGSADGDASPEG